MVWTSLEPGQTVPRTQQSHSGLHKRPNKAVGNMALLKPSSHFISNVIKYTHRKKDEWEGKTLRGEEKPLPKRSISSDTNRKQLPQSIASVQVDGISRAKRRKGSELQHREEKQPHPEQLSDLLMGSRHRLRLG